MDTPLLRHLGSSTSLLQPSASRYRTAASVGSARSSLLRATTPSLLSGQFSLDPDPAEWGPIALSMDETEPDDYLHNPDPLQDSNRRGNILTSRGFANLGCLFILIAAIITLFAGFPILSHFLGNRLSDQGGFNIGGINATGQVAKFPGNFGLIDLDTPKEAYKKASYMNPGDEWDLVFSDEFEVDGRTFYPGDDPYWEAGDLHYWQTNDLEWYDPVAATTKDGALKLTLSEVDNVLDNHNMTYRSGMIQSWNKFCFTGGLIEAAVILPGANNVAGLWPAVWTMGNLGRAGFGASLDGMWPYSYDSCDVGTLPNQTYPGTQTPLAAVENGDPYHNNMLSYLPGQRLSSCTCPGESHPGPVRKNGVYVGRSAPEIDLFEATVTNGVGEVSQSAQWAPFNAEYVWLNTTANLKIYDTTQTVLNSYVGGAYQQTTSGLSITAQDCYELGTGCYSVYGFEYVSGFDNAYITWINNGTKVWSIMVAGMGADTSTEIGPRAVPQEPMYIIANLGFSKNFGKIDFDHLVLPATMSVDYIRVYQPKNAHNVGCDPADFPTAAYIDAYQGAYTNANLTVWGEPGYNQTLPRNRLNGGC